MKEKNKFLKIGRNKGFIDNLEELKFFKKNKDNFQNFFHSKKFIFFYFRGFIDLLNFIYLYIIKLHNNF